MTISAKDIIVQACGNIWRTLSLCMHFFSIWSGKLFFCIRGLNPPFRKRLISMLWTLQSRRSGHRSMATIPILAERGWYKKQEYQTFPNCSAEYRYLALDMSSRSDICVKRQNIYWTTFKMKLSDSLNNLEALLRWQISYNSYRIFSVSSVVSYKLYSTVFIAYNHNGYLHQYLSWVELCRKIYWSLSRENESDLKTKQ
jgi:hypothetical protein